MPSRPIRIANLRSDHHSMKQQTLATLVALASLTASASADGLNLTGSSAYYKVHPQFHPYPEEKTAVQTIDRFGPVGIGIFLTQPAFKMQVKNIEPGSPAEATGKLKKEQIIDSINGRVLKDMDPRLILGDDRGDDWNRDRGRDRGDDRYNRGDDLYNGGGYDRDRGRDREDDRNRGGRRFVCDAQGPGYRLCRVDTRGGVRMIRQLSKTPCRQNRTWGYERGGVWVDGGCRAEFEVR